MEVYAVRGIDGRLRANKKQITREIFEAKVWKWLGGWPGVSVIPRDEC